MNEGKDKDPKPALKFELLLTAELEKAVQDYGVPAEMSQVADLQLAFDNAELLRKLEQRANHLKAAKFEKAAEVEAQMTKLKTEKLEKFMRPNTFYVTFKYEDTLQKALAMKEFEFCNGKISLKRAKEPTNIIWENRDITKNERRMRGAGVIAIMALIHF